MTEIKNQTRIAYYSINDPLDKRSWSGATYYLGQSIKRNIGDIHFLGPVKIPWILDKTFRAIQKLSRFFFKTEWIPKYSLIKNIYAAGILKKKMKGHHYDFLLAPAAAPELGYLNTDIPIVYFGDATYKIYSETYKKEFKDLNSFSRWEGEHLEKRALKKSSLIIFTSRWAALSAINDYGVHPDKIEVIQMGANIDSVPDKNTIFNKEKNKTLTLLFLSVDWDRKGGSIAFDTLKELYKTNKDISLIVCGCIPPPEYIHPCMQVIPFLNKNETKDFEKFIQILSSSHFLLLPTRADCTPVVNCESGAYGIPVITTNVGGVSDAVKDGINGYCLPLKANGADYASLITKIFSDKEKYHALIESSRKRFDDELNWDKFAENLQKALQKHKVLPVIKQ
ncbi:MAG: glycosyltransferase family 4 protein [Bacteroidota bacterium]|nr:glycosyltransferase family 4 protein [Bacteroidota bacterium]